VDWGDILRAALSFFLVLLALTGAFMLIRLATLLGRLTVTVDRLSDEVVPLLEKTNATLEQVNAQLVKIDAMTDSALDAVTAADHSVRSVVTTVKAPLAKIAGVTTGIENALGSFRARRRSRRRPPPTPDPAATDAAALADRGGTAP
jgi:hypothetical protein